MSQSSTSKATILKAALDLTRQVGPFTPRELATAAGLRQSIVNDHLKVMAQTGELEKRDRGIYYHPQARREDYPISITVLPNGDHKIERGPAALLINIHQARMLKMALGNSGCTLSKGYNGAPVVFSVLLDGMGKVETDEEVLELSPREVRLLKVALG